VSVHLGRPHDVRQAKLYMDTSTLTYSINQSFWHFHNHEISDTLLLSVRYYLVVRRAVSNKVLLILREGNPSIGRRFTLRAHLGTSSSSLDS